MSNRKHAKTILCMNYIPHKTCTPLLFHILDEQKYGFYDTIISIDEK